MVPEDREPADRAVTPDLSLGRRRGIGAAERVCSGGGESPEGFFRNRGAAAPVWCDACTARIEAEEKAAEAAANARYRERKPQEPDWFHIAVKNRCATRAAFNPPIQPAPPDSPGTRSFTTLRIHTMMTATYSPEDNKLRLYSLSRLSRELYERMKAAGFRWAPKQELFVTPMWTPDREDLLIELCGEIGDEDTSLVDRAEQRAVRGLRREAVPGRRACPCGRSPRSRTGFPWVSRSSSASTPNAMPNAMPRRSNAACVAR